jgi:flagellar basal body-associated protein FliL
MRRTPTLIILALLGAMLLLLQASPAGASAASGEKKKGGGESFLPMPALTATVMRTNGRRGVLTVEAGLDVPDAGLKARAEGSLPRLRDAYVRFLMTYAASVPAGSPPSPDIIASQLQRATDLTLGKPGARLLVGTILVN